MAQTTIFPGSQIAAFKSIELHKYLKGWRDSRPYRKATHEFPKRDGARQERMGRRPFSTSWTLAFIGEKAIDQLKQLAASLDEDPVGSLVHPIWGQLPAFCNGIDPATVELANAVDTIEFQLSFDEDQLDVSTSAPAQGPAAKSQETQTKSDNYGAAFDALGASLGNVPTVDPAAAAASGAALRTATEATQGAANGYALAAAASAFGQLPDPSLSQRLADVGRGVAAGEAALQAVFDAAVGAMPPGLPSPGAASSTYPMLAAGELLYAAALDLQAAIINDQPSRIRYIVTGSTSLVRLAASLYGGQDALGRADEIMALNRIPNPAALSPGMELVLTAPTVIRP